MAYEEYEETLSERLNRAIGDRDWRDILCHAIDERYLVNKHGPCPVCGDTKPKFRFDNQGGTGSWICVCGYGKGMTLLMKATGQTFTQAALWVIDKFEGPGVKAAAQQLQTRAYQQAATFNVLTEDEVIRRRASLMRRWQEARRVQPGDPVWKYLTGRLPGLKDVPHVIRFHPGMEFRERGAKDGEPDVIYGKFPTMVAAVMDETGKCCNLHRTFLNEDGSRLAIERDGEVLSAKKLMPTLGAKSFAVRLASHNGRLGIGEGLETALAAQLTEGLPTWSVVNTAGMKKFIVPTDVTELVVFADNDELTRQGKRPGFDAAKALADRDDVAARVRTRTLKVSLVTPAKRGHDMANLLLEAHALRLQRAEKR